MQINHQQHINNSIPSQILTWAAHNVVFHFAELYGFVAGVAVVVFLLAHERKETHYLLKGFRELALVHTFDDAVLFVKWRVV
jgi:hypothetical protein